MPGSCTVISSPSMNESYLPASQLHQLERLSLHDSKRVTYQHTCAVVERLIMLGRADRAVQLLLETEPDNDTYYTDCLR